MAAIPSFGSFAYALSPAQPFPKQTQYVDKERTDRGRVRRISGSEETASGEEAPREASEPRVSDRALVDRAREGDSRAFGELVRRHQQRIHRLALHMLRDRADAEDVMQETFVRAYQAIARFDGRSEPYTWLYRIAINLSLNVIRARKPQRRGGDPDDPRLEALMTEKRPSAMADPPGDASRRQVYAAMCEGIDGLSETLRTTLIVVCIDGRSHEEAARILGAPEGTIAWRVHEARRKLRDFLKHRGMDPEGDEG